METDILPHGSTVISCWHCACEVEISQKAAAEARLKPSAHRAAAAAGSVGAGREKGGGLARLVVIAAIAIVVLLVGAVIVVAVTKVIGAAGEAADGQFRLGYHRGDKAPAGRSAWQAKVARLSGFSPARGGSTMFLVANDPRADAAADYAPDGVPEELIEPLRAFHAKMLAEGFVPEGVPQKTALQEEQHERFRATLSKGACYQFTAVGGEKATDVDLLLYQPDGVRLIVADTRGDRDAALKHCPAADGLYEFEVRMHRGKGLVAHAVYKQGEGDFHDRGFVYAYDHTKGQLLWDRRLDGQVSSSPAATDRFVAVGTRTRRRSKVTRRQLDGGALVVLSVEDGATACTHLTIGPVLSSPVIRDGIAYFGTCGEPSEGTDSEICDPSAAAPSKLYAVELGNCDLVWTYTATHAIVLPPAVDETRVYFSAGSKVYAVDRLEGAKVWSSAVGGRATAPSVGAGAVYVGSRDGSVRALEADDGESRWTFEAETPVTGMPAVTGEVVLAGTSDGTLVAIDAETAERVWDLRVGAPIESPVGTAAGLVFVMARDRLVAADMQGSRQFDVPIEEGTAPGSAPVLADGYMVYADSGGTVFALQ